MKNLALLISFSLLTACGASDKSNSENSKSSTLPVEILDLKGSWQAPCRIDNTDNDSSKVMENYTDSGMSINATFYIDSDCSVEEVSTIFTASIVYMGEKILSSGQTVTKVGALINTDNVLMLIHDETKINIAIEEKICGRTDWDSNTYINISKCDTFSNYINTLKGQRKDIYYIDGNHVYWGNDKSTYDAEGFPTELATSSNTKI